MIGIINDNVIAYIISEQIKEKYPKVDIYISNNVDYLIDKGCKIIITSDNYSNDNVIILKIEDYAKEDSYIIDDENLIQAINLGDNKKVLNIIDNLDINSRQTIIINNPKILLIKHLIKEKYSNIIISNIDILLTKLDKVIVENDINTNNSGIFSIIR